MSEAPLNKRGLAFTGVACLVVAGAVAGGLWGLARAPDQADRLRDIRDRRTAASELPSPTSVQSIYPAGAVCEGGLAPALVLLRARVSDAATASGVSIAAIDISPGPSNGAGLSTLRMNLEIDGPYASGLNFMKILADATPTIFVDELDVSARDNGAANWRVSGRLFCAVRLNS